jgi:hypothetical protein
VKIGRLTLERSELLLGCAVTVGSIVVSVAVAHATMQIKLEAHDVELANSYQEVKDIRVQVNTIDTRTARMEGILEEMRRTRKGSSHD